MVDSVTTIVESFAAKTEQPKPTDNTPPADEEDEWHDDNGFINHDELARMLDTVYFLADLDKASDTVRMEILHELNGDLHDEADMLLASMANMAKGLHETSFDSCDEDDGDNEEDSDSEDESVDNVLDALYLKYEDREFVRMVDREMATDTPLDAAMKTVEGVMSAVGVIAGAAGVVALNGKLAEQKEKLLDGAKDQLASGIKKVEQTGKIQKRQCYNVTLLQCYNVTMLQCYNVTMFQCYNVTMLQCNNVTMLQCYNVKTLQCYYFY